MTNKKLAEKLRWYGNLAAMGPVDCELPEEACDDLFEAADALEAMQWVPVTERLPEEGDAVLIRYIGQDGVAYAATYAVWTKNYGFLWKECVYEDDYEEVFVSITHWMSLPRGPEVE